MASRFRSNAVDFQRGDTPGSRFPCRRRHNVVIRQGTRRTAGFQTITDPARESMFLEIVPADICKYAETSIAAPPPFCGSVARTKNLSVGLYRFGSRGNSVPLWRVVRTAICLHGRAFSRPRRCPCGIHEVVVRRVRRWNRQDVGKFSGLREMRSMRVDSSVEPQEWKKRGPEFESVWIALPMTRKRLA